MTRGASIQSLSYPRCPNCGRKLLIDDFYRLVGARRILSFWGDYFRSQRLMKDPLTGEDVPTEFSITCGGCGAKSAVDNSPQGMVQLAIVAVLGLLLVLLVFATGATGLQIWILAMVCLGAAVTASRIAAVITSRTMRVRLISMPDAERDNETPADRRARADRDMDEDVARLGPDYLRVPEPKPLEPELADVAARIDAGYVAAAPSTSERPEYERAEEQELERAKVVCAACGEMNQRDFEKCWNCEGALPVRE